MVLSTAMVDIREKFEVPINDKEYKVLKNKKYMGGKPVPMNLKGTEPAGGVPVAPQATTKEDGTKSGGGSTQPEESPGAKRGGVQNGRTRGQGTKTRVIFFFQKSRYLKEGH